MDEPVSDPVLKPCPFCGGARLVTVEDAQGRHMVQCATCFACGPRLSNMEGVAALDWNERVATDSPECGEVCPNYDFVLCILRKGHVGGHKGVRNGRPAQWPSVETFDVREANRKLCATEGHVLGVIARPCLRCH